MSDMSILQSSDNYIELDYLNACNYACEVRNGWLDPDMPRRQYETVVAKELEAYASDEHVAPYDVLVSLLRECPLPSGSTILDVGAASGYYSEVLDIADIPYLYVGLDFSEHFAKLATKLFGIPYIVADAANMHMIDPGTYDIVLSGGVIMHSMDYPAIIHECKRVARKQVIFHRTPVRRNDPQQYFVKQAYGLECLEIHFDEEKLMKLFLAGDWKLAGVHIIDWDIAKCEGYKSYLLERV